MPRLEIAIGSDLNGAISEFGARFWRFVE